MASRRMYGIPHHPSVGLALYPPQNPPGQRGWHVSLGAARVKEQPGFSLLCTSPAESHMVLPEAET